MMIGQITDRVTKKMIENGLIELEQKKFYSYAMKIPIEQVLTYTIIFCIAFKWENITDLNIIRVL